MLVKLYVFLTFLINFDLLFKPLLSVLSNLSIFLFKSLAFLIDFGELLLDLNHQLLISDGHYIPKEDKLIVAIEDIHYILGRFFFQDFCFDLTPKFVKIGPENIMSSFSKLYLLLPIFICDKLSEEFLQRVFSVCP